MKKHAQVELKQNLEGDETAVYVQLLKELQELRDDLVKSENGFSNILQLVNVHNRAGAINLVHTLRLRHLSLLLVLGLFVALKVKVVR